MLVANGKRTRRSGWQKIPGAGAQCGGAAAKKSCWMQVEEAQHWPNAHLTNNTAVVVRWQVESSLNLHALERMNTVRKPSTMKRNMGCGVGRKLPNVRACQPELVGTSNVWDLQRHAASQLVTTRLIWRMSAASGPASMASRFRPAVVSRLSHQSMCSCREGGEQGGEAGKVLRVCRAGQEVLTEDLC